jgi:hypothetical protein
VKYNYIRKQGKTTGKPKRLSHGPFICLNHTEERKRIIEKAIKESEGTGERKTIILKGD